MKWEAEQSRGGACNVLPVQQVHEHVALHFCHAAVHNAATNENLNGVREGI